MTTINFFSRKEKTPRKKGKLSLSSALSKLPALSRLSTLPKLPCKTSLRSALAVFCLLFVIGIGSVWGRTTIEKTISSVVSDSSFIVSSGNTTNTICLSLNLDANINISINAGGNNGSFWGTDPIDWRIYQVQSGTITITALNECTLDSVKFTYSASNGGVINTSGNDQSIGDSYQISSNVRTEITGTSITYYVGNSGNKTNGQVRITAISVTYTSAGGSTYSITYADTNGEGTNGDYSASSTSSIDSGTEITLTATPDDCYQLDSWNVYKTGDESTTITVTNNKFNMPAYDVTVGATFEEVAAGWTVNFDAGPGTSDDDSLEETCRGAGVTLPNVTASGVCKGWGTFAGWATAAVDDSTTTSVTVYSAGSKFVPSSNGQTLYAVYSKNKSGGAVTWTQVTSVAVDDEVVIAQVDDGTNEMSGFNTTETTNNNYGTYSAFSTNPAGTMIWTVEAGNSTGQFSFKNGDYYLNLGDNDNHLNGSSSKNAYSSWAVETVNSRAVVTNAQFTTRKIMWNKSSPRFATYAKDHGLNSGNQYYYHIVFYKKSGGTTTYYCSDPDCCPKLGSIDGTISLTQGGNSVTISDWSTVSNASSYTVKMYKKNGGGTWDLVSGSTSGGSAGTDGTRTDISEANKSVTYTGLVVESEYKFSITAIGNGTTHCDGDETFVTSINSTDVSSSPFKFRYSIYIDDGTKNDTGWGHHYITPTGNTDEGSVTISLHSITDYYQFKIAGGFSGWWGQGAPPSKIPDDTKWTLNGDQNVQLETTNAGTYTFTVDYSGTTNPGVTVTFPTMNQASGYKIYWDNSILNWETYKYRIGNTTHNQNQDFTLVPGTDQFYVTTTPTYNDMAAWVISNNVAWSGDGNSIYTVNPGTYNITASTTNQEYVVTSDVTIIPDAVSSGSSNGCSWYPISSSTGMLMHTATIIAPSNGTINIAYTNTSNVEQPTNTTTISNLAHRTKLTATATANTGYELTSFTVTPSGDSPIDLSSNNGTANNHILSKDATFAATFSAKETTITLNTQSATIDGTTSVTATYDDNTTLTSAITKPAKTGCAFGGYWTLENGGGSQLIDTDGNWIAEVAGYTDASKKWKLDASTLTLYAYWLTAKEFELVSNAASLDDGDEIVLTSKSATSPYAMSTTQESDYRGYVTGSSNFTLSGTTLTVPAGSSVQTIVLEKSDDYWLLNVGNNEYLYSGTSNKLKTSATITGNSIWDIVVDPSGADSDAQNNATITSQGDNTSSNVLRYNSGSPRFNCYSSGNQQPVKIYCYHRSDPYIRISPAAMETFAYAVGYGPSLPQAINIKGYNLNDNLTVTCPSGYELSNTSPSSGFGTSNLTLTKDVNDKVNETIYIRLSAGKSAGSYNQTLSISGGGITTTSTSLIGTVSATPSGTAYTLVSNEVDIFPDDEIVIMNASGTRLLSNAGSNNRKAAYATGNFAFMGSAVFTDTNSDSIQNVIVEGCDDEWLFYAGDVESTKTYLYAPGNGGNNYLKSAAINTAGDNGKWRIRIDNNLNDTIKSIGESTNNQMWFNGNNTSIFSCYSNPQTELPRIFAKPSATPNVCGSPSALNGFETVSGNPSEAKVFSVKARNISTGNVRVTAPTGYKVRLLENDTYTEYIDLTPTNNNIAPTNVYVRLTGEGKGETNGNIEITATGATTRTIALTGTVTPLTVTYHSDSDADPHVAEVAYGENAPAYSPANCAADRVFVGWSSAIQQTEPILETQDGSLDTIVTTNTDLYAVFASRNGSAGHDYIEDFDSYSTYSYNSSTPKTYGIWSVVYGTTSTIADVLERMESRAMVLQKEAGGKASMTTTQKIHNFTGLTCKIATTDYYLGFKIEYSTNGSSWTTLKDLTYHSSYVAYPYSLSIVGAPVDAYVRFIIEYASGTGSSYRMYIDDVTLHTKPHDWVLTDYSTSCYKQTGLATLTWNNGDEEITSSQTIGENITLPSLAKDNYIFEGWEVTAEGQSKATGIYYAEEAFLVNHNIYFDAKWTQLFSVTNPTYGVTSYKDITTTSLPHTFRTVAAKTLERPVVNAVSDDVRFSVTITGAELDGTDSVYTFVYTYTPDNFGSGSGAATNTATVTFRDPVSGTISAPVTLRGRSLPEEFVIAVKDNDNKWYALPNTIVGNSAAIKPILISVDNKTTPSQVSYAPNTTVYKGTGRYSNDANVYGIRFTDGDDHWLQVSNSSSTNYVWLASSGAPYSSTCQDWLLTSRDFGAYILTVPTSESGDKKFGIYGHNIGYYSSPTSDTVYLLPITNKYEPVAANVYEWGEHGVVLNADMTNVVSATIHIDDATPSPATVTSVNAASLTAGKYVKVDAGELTIGAVANEGKLLYIHWKNSGGEEIGVSQIKIPCIIASNATMHNLESRKTQWSGKEVHVLPGVTLTADGNLFTDNNVTINELHIYPGATLNVQDGTLIATTLRLRNGWTRVGEKQYNTARVFVADGATLVKGTASMDYDIYDAAEGRHYYPLAVPYQTAVNTIDYADTWLAGFSNYGANGQYVIKEYDGANRAENGVNDENNWDVVSADANLIPGKGYIITAVPVKGEAIIRIPLDGETTNTIAVTAHTGAAATSNKRHAGWNMLGVPYMSCYTTGTNMYGGEGDAVLMQGKMEIVGGSEPFGGYNTDVVYVTVPTHDFSEYLQTDITETTLLPGWCFFVQIGTSGNLHFLNASQAQNSETPIYAPTRTTEEQQVVRAGIILSHAEKSDKTTLLVSNRFSSDYEIGADLEKMFGSGYTLALYSLANTTRLVYNALSTIDAKQLIPLGFRAPEEGEYTVSFENRYYDDPPDRIDLIDYQTGAITDLLSQDYTFFSQQTQDDTRFAINIVMKQNTPTGLDEHFDDSNKVQKIILNNSFFIIRDGHLYDATGKKVKEGQL